MEGRFLQVLLIFLLIINKGTARWREWLQLLPNLLSPTFGLISIVSLSHLIFLCNLDIGGNVWICTVLVFGIIWFNMVIENMVKRIMVQEEDMLVMVTLFTQGVDLLIKCQHVITYVGQGDYTNCCRQVLFHYIRGLEYSRTIVRQYRMRRKRVTTFVIFAIRCIGNGPSGRWRFLKGQHSFERVYLIKDNLNGRVFYSKVILETDYFRVRA